MNVGSLFSGIGGIELGFHRQGFTTLWFIEHDPYATNVLKKNFPSVPIFGDITNIDFSTLPKVDVITGGFPCQDASNARCGHGKGIEGTKTGLWKYFKEAIRTIRPKFALIENVPNLINRGFEKVLCDLAEVGYHAQWQIIRTGHFGYPHRRDRLFILAHTTRIWMERIQQNSFKTQPIKSITIPKKTLANWYDELLEPPLLRANNGFPKGMDRLRCTGNAVVPDVAEIFAREIRHHLTQQHNERSNNHPTNN